MKDFLGREVAVGDTIFYSTTGRNAESRFCEVTRFTAKSMFAKLIKGNRNGGSWSAKYNDDFVVRNDFVKVEAPSDGD